MTEVEEHVEQAKIRPSSVGEVCDKRPALYIESKIPAVVVMVALLVAIGAFVWMAWKFDLLRKAIPEFDLA
jgi:hypothetical protein